MRIKKSDLIAMIICVFLTIFSTSGSFYSAFRPRGQLLLAVLFGGLLLLITVKKPFFKNAETILAFFMLIIFLVNNAELRNRSWWGLLLLFILAIYFVFASCYLKISWIQYTFKLMKTVYMFYALYTIAMYFDSGLLEMAIKLIPYTDGTAAARMWSQYNKGWMPGLTTHYSTNGMLLVVGFLIFGALYICRKKRSDFYSFIISLVALLLTAKRAHIVFGVFSIYVVYYVYSSNRKKGRLFKLLGAALLALTLFIIISRYVPALSSFVDRFIDTAEDGDVTMGRTAVWLVALGQFRSHPLLGIGWGQFTGRGLWLWDVHNIYIQLLCETGILGFSIYLSWMILFIIKTWKRLNFVRMNRELYSDEETLFLFFSLAMQLFFMMYGATGNPLYEQIQYVPYFIACAISLNSTRGRFEVYSATEKSEINTKGFERMESR